MRRVVDHGTDGGVGSESIERGSSVRFNGAHDGWKEAKERERKCDKGKAAQIADDVSRILRLLPAADSPYSAMPTNRRSQT
jgi:hypothetical protein